MKLIKGNLNYADFPQAEYGHDAYGNEIHALYGYTVLPAGAKLQHGDIPFDVYSGWLVGNYFNKKYHHSAVSEGRWTVWARKNPIYMTALDLGLTEKNRWEDGTPHHPKSEELMAFLAEHDFRDYDDYFCWKKGGDGDNGEALMYQLDAYFETKDYLKSENGEE